MAHEKDALVELKQSLETRGVDLAYEKACHQVEMVLALEKARQLRVQTLFLEEKNDELQLQLAQYEDRLCELEIRKGELEDDVQTANTSLHSARGDLRITSRDIETLKAELNSLHGVTMDSTKLLAEKLTLARELSSLRPEVDHLRSQAALHQSLLAEKLSLQRQLNIVQVELETEKRSAKRILAKEKKSQAEDLKVESRIETLRGELAMERRGRRKDEGDAHKAYTELESKISTLEPRLDAFKTKLKTSKEQLKETQAALESAQNVTNTTSIRGKRPSGITASWAKHPRKRTAGQMDADTTIGTPGDPPAARKSKRTSFNVGEKSTFSITPFLNRTASIAPESPSSRTSVSDDEVSTEPQSVVPGTDRVNHVSNLTTQSSEVITSSTRTRKRRIPSNAKASRATLQVPPGRKTKAAPALEQVVEEGSMENDAVIGAFPTTTRCKGALSETLSEGVEIKRKKRKLLGGGLGKPLLDDDNGDNMKGDGNLTEGVRSFGTLARGGLAGSKLAPSKALGSSMSTFSAISPLKKDKKSAA